MSTQTVEQVGANLKQIFGNAVAIEPFYDKWCELGSFLTKKADVLKAMAALDEQMFNKLSDNVNLRTGEVLNREMVTPAYSNYYKKVVSLKNLTKKDATHLLSDVLTESEEIRGFKTEPGETQQSGKIAVDRTTPTDTRKHVPSYHGFVQAKDFNKQLTKKTHWKDPGAQIIHGEFTHRLQWYAVISGLLNTGDTAANVFEAIGNYSGKFDRKGAEGPPFLYLWDALCDRTNGVDVSFKDKEFLTSDGPKRGDDFRSPENLHSFLLSNDGFLEHRWPLLKIFLEARRDKRQPQFEASEKFKVDDPMLLFQCAYLAKKLYALSYDDMIKDAGKKDVISKLIGEDSDQIWKF